MENGTEVPQTTENRIATPGHISRENYHSKRYMHPYVHSSTIHNSQDMEAGTSLVAQWLRLHTPSAGGLGSIPGQGTRSHLHATTKSLHATTKEPS